GILGTFALVVIGWIIFRAENISQAVGYIVGIFNSSLLSPPTISNTPPFAFGSLGIFVLLIIEWINRNQEFGLDISKSKLSAPVRGIVYICILLLTFYFGGQGAAFIYFQF
ncbi:MAG: MBOAT family protein, partial [Rikenellaceae bacterium]